MAKQRFLAGHSARTVCSILGIAESSFHKRKALEGWRRCDQERPLIDDFDEHPDSELPLEPHELRDVAWRHAARAICRGDRMGARTWLRTVRELEAIQDREDGRRKDSEQELDDEAALLCDALRRQGVEPADVPLLRSASEVDGHEFAFQRNIDLHRALVEARGEPDPYPQRPRPGAVESSESSECIFGEAEPAPKPFPAQPVRPSDCAGPAAGPRPGDASAPSASHAWPHNPAHASSADTLPRTSSSGSADAHS